MKKTLFLLISLLFMTSLMSQTTILKENFTTWPASGWETYILDEGGYWRQSWSSGPDGKFAEHNISNDDCNNWLVTPQIMLIDDTYSLSFWEFAGGIEYYVYAGIFISTGSGDPNDGEFVELMESSLSEDWVEQTIDLSAYAGQNIYIGYQYTGTWSQWGIDLVQVSPPAFTDGALQNIVNPSGIAPDLGIEDITVPLYNNGTEVIDNADLDWSINNVFQNSYNASNLNLQPGESVDLTIGQYNFDQTGLYLIGVELNITEDINPGNDMIEGTYTISDPKDAALIAIYPNGYLPLGGENTVKVTIDNVGGFVIDEVEVSWLANNVAQTPYQQSGLALNPGESTTLNIGQYNFQNGLTEVSATITVVGDVNPDNNSFISYTSVGTLWESFEGSLFPPFGWTSDYSFHGDGSFLEPKQGSFYYDCQVDDNYFGEISDTLFTPMLEIETGDQFSFWVNRNSFFMTNLSVIWKNGETGEIQLLEEIGGTTEQWVEHVVDISAAAGNNYIGLLNVANGSFGYTPIDLISSDASLFLYDHDVAIIETFVDPVAHENQAYIFDCLVKNAGKTNIENGAYTIRLMKEGGAELASINGEALEIYEERIIELEYIFSGVSANNLYLEVVYNDDQNLSNNQSSVFTVNGVPSESLVLEIGEMDYPSPQIPFDVGGDTWTFATDDLSQTIYYQEDLNVAGEIYGINYYYRDQNSAGQYIPLKVWITETDQANLEDGWIPYEVFTPVFDDTISVETGLNYIYIPFTEPYLYTGTQNIAIQCFAYEPEWPATGTSFMADEGTGNTRTLVISNSPNLNPEDPPDFYSAQNNVAYIEFVIEAINNTGVVSGMVKDMNNEALEGIHISVEGTSTFTETDAGGHYTLPALPFSDYTIMASGTGYFDNALEITIDEESEVLDFTMEELPLISLFGVVYGSNDQLVPLENVSVNLLSDDISYEVFTDEDGYFVFVDVFGETEYMATYQKYGYEELTAEVLSADANLNLGDIILSEEFISAYNVHASADQGSAMIEWKSPQTSTKDTLKLDNGNITFSYTNEPFEDVSLGNLFEIDSPVTITTVEVRWDYYELVSDFVSIDILDHNGNVMASSEPFLTIEDAWSVVDIPNLTLENDFYVMVHWQDNPDYTHALCIDQSDGTKNRAYIKYPGEEPVLLSDYIGSLPGSFFVRTRILEEDNDNRAVLSYNIYKGLAEDIENANNWAALNSGPVFDLSFIDETWSGIDPNLYTFAVEAIYTEGEAEVSFSNFIAGMVSVEEFDVESIQVFPNPASEVLYLENVENAVISIYDGFGALVLQVKSNNQQFKIDVRHYSTGTYLVQIHKNQSTINKKILIIN